jgi:hypothetical protein
MKKQKKIFNTTGWPSKTTNRKLKEPTQKVANYKESRRQDGIQKATAIAKGEVRRWRRNSWNKFGQI